jgi:hypothetical protein
MGEELEMKNKGTETPFVDAWWKNLITLGGIAALTAGVLFRRNLAVEIGLFGAPPAPAGAKDWFLLLQSNRILGLAYLHVFDLANYALVGLMLLALYVLLRRVSAGGMAVAAAAGFLGIAVYFASNTAFSMLSLSDQYAAAATDREKILLEAAGQALLSINRFTGAGAHPGSGGWMSLLLVAVSGLITSAVMLRSGAFHRAAAFAGILAGTLDAAFCAVFLFTAADVCESLSLIFIPAAGFFWMIFHIATGWTLLRLRKASPPSTA